MVNVTANGGGGVVGGSFESAPAFPATIKVGESGDWQARVINSGSFAEVIFFGIENKATNPGSVTIDYGSGPTIIPLNNILRLYTTVEPGAKIGGVNGLSGTIVFSIIGSHLLGLHAGHRNVDETWTTDEYLEVNG